MFVFLLISSLFLDDGLSSEILECEDLLVDVLHPGDADPVLVGALLDLELDLVLHQLLFKVLNNPLLFSPDVILLLSSEHYLCLLVDALDLVGPKL